MYKELFGKQLVGADWGILQKYINLYGRWIVYEALIRTATASIDSTKSIWPYMNSVALALLEADRKRQLIQHSQEAQIKSTLELVSALKSINASAVTQITDKDL